MKQLSVLTAGKLIGT